MQRQHSPPQLTCIESILDLSAPLLEKAIVMNQNRILCRLQSRHAKWHCNFKKVKLARPPILRQVVQLFREKCTVIQETSFIPAVDDLEKHSISLELLEPVDAASVSGMRIIVDILHIVHCLWSRQDFRQLFPPAFFDPHWQNLADTYLLRIFLSEKPEGTASSQAQGRDCGL